MFTLFAFKIDIFVSMLIRPEKTKNYFQMTCDVICDLTFKCFTFWIVHAQGCGEGLVRRGAGISS